MFEDDVEPTNNHSEQQVRHCVINRKITQGTRSLMGQRYHERMWTAIGRRFSVLDRSTILPHLYRVHRSLSTHRRRTKRRVIVRNNNLPDNEKTGDHRPIEFVIR